MFNKNKISSKEIAMNEIKKFKNILFNDNLSNNKNIINEVFTEEEILKNDNAD